MCDFHIYAKNCQKKVLTKLEFTFFFLWLNYYISGQRDLNLYFAKEMTNIDYLTLKGDKVKNISNIHN